MFGPPVACFMVLATDRQLLWGRVREDGECAAEEGQEHRFGHHAMVALGDARVDKREDGFIAPTPWERYGDADWPAECVCGHAFTPEAERNTIGRQLWRHAETGETRPVDGMASAELELWGPGAMFDAWWLPWKGPDGLSLSVMLPRGGVWHIDGFAGGEGPRRRPWSRTGAPPRVTASPSIWSHPNEGPPHEYHGRLHDGVLVSV